MMKIQSIGSFSPELQKLNETKKNNGQPFGNILTDFIGDVNKSQFDAVKMTEDFITGKDVELHEVMIAGEKAKTSLDLLMEIRNKTIDMYKELIRMQQ